MWVGLYAFYKNTCTFYMNVCMFILLMLMNPLCQAMDNAGLQSRLDESHAKVQSLQENIIKLQVCLHTSLPYSFPLLSSFVFSFIC